MTPQELHEDCVQCANDYKRAEAQLPIKLARIEREKAYVELGYGNLHDYVVRGLGFTEGQAYLFMQIARKSETHPELKKAIVNGDLTVSKSKRILSVITPE